MTTITSLQKMKADGEKIAVLTSYDAGFARVSETAGIDVLLVGDSLGMVVQGHDSTLPVTMKDMVYHTANVSRVTDEVFVIADMPFMSYSTPERALKNAGRLMKQGGARMVKLEGGAVQLDIVRTLTAHAVPVCAHLGLLPQSVHQMGGYHVQGRDKRQAKTILDDAIALQLAGARMLVLECVPELLAQEVTRALDIPVIGIGAGKHVDGQVLVVYDMLGLGSGRMPRFVKNFLESADSIETAVRDYVNAVKQQQFPGPEHCYQ